jgi:creatinine amidohydrolase
MSRSISDLTSPEVAEQIRRNPIAVLPFGSVEQHGPHLPNGTDIIAGEVVAEALAEELDALVVPFSPYGVTPIHAGHPGTISLSRPTFEALLTDICTELIAMGINRLVFVNWHEGNIASMDGVATEIQKAHDDVYVITSHACYVAQRIYRAQGGELTHGGGIEAMSVMARDPALVHIDRAGDSTRPDHAIAMDEMRRSGETHGYITDVTEIDADGWYGDPTWATEELAEEFAATVAGEIAKQVQGILLLRGSLS